LLQGSLFPHTFKDSKQEQQTFSMIVLTIALSLVQWFPNADLRQEGVSPLRDQEASTGEPRNAV